MERLRAFWASTVGKKIVMALSGLILVAFTVAHMAGNLQAFVSPERFDAYAHLLQGPLIELVWVQRVVLLIAVVLHVVAAVQLTLRNRAARPEAYAKKEAQAATFAARTLRLGGLILLVFIVYHLLHFTTGTLHPDFRRGQAYHNLITGLRSPAVAWFYLIAMAALALHLFHGVWSSVRTLGAAPPSANPFKRRAALGLAVIIAGGFAAVPIAVMIGWLR